MALHDKPMNAGTIRNSTVVERLPLERRWASVKYCMRVYNPFMLCLVLNKCLALRELDPV